MPATVRTGRIRIPVALATTTFGMWVEWDRDGGTAALNVSLSGSGGGMNHSDGDMDGSYGGR